MAKNRGIVSRIDVDEFAGCRIVFGEDGGGEALATKAVSTGIVIQARGQLGERESFGGDGAKAGLQRGHQESGGNTLAGDVGHDEHELAAGSSVIGGIEGVVIVPGNGILRAGIKGDIGIGNGWRSGRNEPGLNFAGDFQVALHGDFIGEFEGEQKKKDQRGKQFEIEFEVDLVTEVELHAGHDKKNERDDHENAAYGSELVEHGLEEFPGDAEGTSPAREFVYVVPIDVFAIEAVAGASVRGKLGPEILKIAALADALPEVAEAREGVGARWGGRTHGVSICDKVAKFSDTDRQKGEDLHKNMKPLRYAIRQLMQIDSVGLWGG